MANSFVLLRTVAFEGFAVPVVVGVYASEEEARAAATDMTRLLEMMVNCKLQRSPAAGPVEQARSVADVLLTLGIVGFQHHVRDYDVREVSPIIVPQKQLIVPS